MTTLWDNISSSLKERLGEQPYQTWIRPLKCLSLEEDTLILQVPNKFIRDWIRDHYSGLILTRLKESTTVDWSLRLLIDESASVTPLAQDTPTESITKEAPISGFNPRYTFDHFVVGPSNQFAHAVCRAVASARSEQYNPLFLYGGVGLGKTHLLHAIGIEVLKKNPRSQIHYISAEKFMNELIYAIRFDKMNAFRQKFRHQCDYLLIDDIQFIAGKERTQEEFFHTFNSLYENQCQIVLTCDRFPKEIPDLEDRLRSRFEWGLIADIQSPDLETRIAIIKKKAEQEKIPLPDEVALFLASHVKSNVRELEGSLIRVSAFASLAGSSIHLSLAREVLRNVLGSSGSAPTIERIQEVVAKFYSIRLSDLLGAKRFKSFALPRQVAMYLCRKHVKASYPELGHKFGGKDHSTVVHAVTKIEKKSTSDPHFEQELLRIENQLNI